MSSEKKVYIQTYGCQMNEYDSRTMAGLLAEDGYRRVDDAESADLILVNTCAIRDKAEHKVFSILGRYRDLKRERPDLMIGVGGCVAQEHGVALQRRAPYVDLVFGTQNIRHIRDLVRDAQGARGLVATEWAPDAHARFRDGDMLAPYGSVDNITAFVTVAEGCDHFCSYCIVPFTRGREASRKPEHIVDEVKRLTEQGVVEVTLLGQNVNSYGKKTDFDFARLLESVCAIPEIRRVRFTSPHPRDLSEAQIDAYGALPELCRHLHLPVQSGSNRLLKLMNRRYTVEEYQSKIERLRAVDPTISVTSDLIVGYPGETEEDFEQTIALMEQVRFSSLYAFKYSPRPGTRSAKLDDDVPAEVKSERLHRILRLQEGITRDYHEALVGKSLDVLVERRDDDVATGRTSCNRLVHFSGEGEPRDIVNVSIFRAFATALRGHHESPRMVESA